MEGQELVVKQGEIVITPPDVILNNATIAAKALADVISRKKHPIVVGGEQYLENEDWQTVGQFYGYTTKTHDAIPVEVDGIKGAKAYADLIEFHTGLIIGGAESYCMRDEDKWKNKPWFQLASMAQTRASSKAYKNRLSWVVVLAGYKTTPAEEMTGTENQTMPVEHLCPIHNVPFFKKGKMKSYAHPIADTGEWCHELSDNQKPPTESGGMPSSMPEVSKPATPKAETGNPQPETLLEQALKCKDGVDLYTFAVRRGKSLTAIVSAGLPRDPREVKSVEAAAKVLFG